MIWLLLAVGISFILLFIYCCCVIASRSDHQVGADYEEE